MSIVLTRLSLHKRAHKLLTEYSDKLEAADRDYLQDMFDRKIIWGTPFQVKRMDAVEKKLFGGNSA